ncbi:MAG TPA: mechanosensitive ion channel family protein, partial [Burkholderiales bacterium]
MISRIPVLLLLLAALLGLAAPPLSAQEAAPAPATLESDIDTAPVELDGRVLLRVRGASSLAAQTRAQRIQDRIEAVAGDPSVGIDSIHAVDAGDITSIMAGNRLLLAITDADARLEQLGRGDLTRVHTERIRQAVADYRGARTTDALRQGALNAAGATVAAALAIALLIWLGRRLDKLLERRVQTRIRSLAVQSFEFVRAERIGSALRGAVRGLEALAILVIAFLWLDFVLAQFPWSLPLSRHLLDLVLSPLATIGKAILRKVPDLIFL